jgi:hypothetical protein
MATSALSPYLRGVPRLWPEKNLLYFSGDDGLSGSEPWALPLEAISIIPRPFHRGDPNQSGTTDISDAITIFGFFFLGDPATVSCRESADTNNDSTIDISDGIYLLSWLFTGGSAPVAPGAPATPCGLDDTDLPGSPGDLGCTDYDQCNRRVAH